MAQKSWTDGDVLTASDITTYLTGEGGAWRSRTPTWTNVTLGTSPTNEQRYAEFGPMVVVEGVLTLGTGGSFTATVTVDLPVTPASRGNGTANYTDTGTANFSGTCRVSGVVLVFYNDTGASAGNVGATSPFTWTATDVLRYTVIYEGA